MVSRTVRVLSLSQSSNGDIAMSSSASGCVRIMSELPNVTLDWTDTPAIASKLAHCGVSSLGHSCVSFLPTTSASGTRTLTNGTTIHLHVRQVATFLWTPSWSWTPSWTASWTAMARRWSDGSAEQRQSGKYAAHGKKRSSDMV